MQHPPMPQKYDKAKHKSEIFLDMKKILREMMSSSPEIIEKAIKDRNIIIKSLKADIDHRKIAFTEIETRYDVQFNTIKNISEDNKNLKLENEILLKKVKIISDELDDAKIIIGIDKKEKERTLSFKLDKLSDKIPGWAGKIVFKILSSQHVLNYMLMAIFCLLFIASFVGWGAIATILKPIFALFI